MKDIELTDLSTTGWDVGVDTRAAKPPRTTFLCILTPLKQFTKRRLYRLMKNVFLKRNLPKESLQSV
jgi:hypothetical protein